jgi:hypothetical protein
MVICLLALPGCARFFPSDPANPRLGLIRVADHFEIRMPSCAKGLRQNILVQDNELDTTKNIADIKVHVLWEVSQPWPAENRAVVLGETTPGMTIHHAYVPVSAFPSIQVDVSSDQQTWIGIFDLRAVGTSLSGDVGEPGPISQHRLDEIGGC